MDFGNSTSYFQHLHLKRIMKFYMRIIGKMLKLSKGQAHNNPPNENKMVKCVMSQNATRREWEMWVIKLGGCWGWSGPFTMKKKSFWTCDRPNWMDLFVSFFIGCHPFVMARRDKKKKCKKVREYVLYFNFIHMFPWEIFIISWHKDLRNNITKKWGLFCSTEIKHAHSSGKVKH